MADILSDLEGIIGAAEAAKIRANPTLATRLQRGESYREYMDGDMSGDPPPPVRREEPPPPARAAAGAGSLDDVLGELNKVTERLGNIPKVVEEEVNKVVEKRGGELVGNAVATAMRNTLDILDVSSRNREELGIPLDRTKLEAHAKAAQEAGRPFRTVEEAWLDMTREERLQKQIATGVETGVREKLKERSNATLPGVSAPGSSPMLNQLHKIRNRTGAAGEQSAVSNAARALEERLAARGELVA
jgi:hypothetical protein